MQCKHVQKKQNKLGSIANLYRFTLVRDTLSYTDKLIMLFNKKRKTIAQSNVLTSKTFDTINLKAIKYHSVIKHFSQA